MSCVARPLPLEGADRSWSVDRLGAEKVGKTQRMPLFSFWEIYRSWEVKKVVVVVVVVAGGGSVSRFVAFSTSSKTLVFGIHNWCPYPWLLEIRGSCRPVWFFVVKIPSRSLR